MTTKGVFVLKKPEWISSLLSIDEEEAIYIYIYVYFMLLEETHIESVTSGLDSKRVVDCYHYNRREDYDG